MSTYYVTFQVVMSDGSFGGGGIGGDAVLRAHYFETDVPEDTRAWIEAAEADFLKTMRRPNGRPTIAWWRKLNG